MNWLNVRVSVLHSPEFIGKSPKSRATWFNILLWSAEQENGGRITGARLWTSRQWQQTCGVTLREVLAAHPLLTIDGEDVIVWNYPIEKQLEVIEKREAGRRGGQATSGQKAATARVNGAKGGRPITQAELEAELGKEPKLEPKDNPSKNPTEGEGEGEGKGKEDLIPSATPSAPAGDTAKKKAEATDPRHGEICKRWGLLFTAAFGASYAFSGRDASALKRFLPSIKNSADEILSVAQAAWERGKSDRFARHSKAAATIHGLCAEFNDIRVELASPEFAAIDKTVATWARP